MTTYNSFPETNASIRETNEFHTGVMIVVTNISSISGNILFQHFKKQELRVTSNLELICDSPPQDFPCSKDLAKRQFEFQEPTEGIQIKRSCERNRIVIRYDFGSSPLWVKRWKA